jgi:hypothetical protein
MILTCSSDRKRKDINIELPWGNLSNSDNLKERENIKMNIRNNIAWEMDETDSASRLFIHKLNFHVQVTECYLFSYVAFKYVSQFLGKPVTASVLKLEFFFIVLLITSNITHIFLTLGAHSSIHGSRAMLQAGRSRV